MKTKMDLIHIEQLEVTCIIGVLDWERKRPQKIFFDLTLETDCKKAAKTDDLDDTVNYTAIAKEVMKLAEKSKCFLIERLAEEVAGHCLKSFPIKSITVKISKPSAIRAAKAVAVEIHRQKK